MNQIRLFSVTEIARIAGISHMTVRRTFRDVALWPPYATTSHGASDVNLYSWPTVERFIATRAARTERVKTK